MRYFEKKNRKKMDVEWLADFCLQVFLSLKARVLILDGIEEMAREDGEEKELLNQICGEMREGKLFYAALNQTKAFPSWMVSMVGAGEKKGNLRERMGELADFYREEAVRRRQISEDLTASLEMAGMLLIVLFVLFTQVLPVFGQVYAQMGMGLPWVLQAAAQVGGLCCGSGLILVISAWMILSSSEYPWAERIKRWGRKKSRIWMAESGRRFALVLHLALKSGLELGKGMELAWEAGGWKGKTEAEDLKTCMQERKRQEGSLDVMGEAGRFGRFHLLMIQGGMERGDLETVMGEIAKDYEQQAERLRRQLFVWLEPVMAGILTGGTGFVLLCVLLPLAGVVAGMG